MNRILICIIVGMLVTGCVTLGDKKTGSKKSWKYTKELDQNISIKEDVVSLLGPADTITSGSNGGEIYYYKYIKEEFGKVGFFWDLKGSSSKMDCLMCFFDANGILTDCQIKLEGKKAKSIF